MSDDTPELDEAAGRLELALERIAARAQTAPVAAPSAIPVEVIASRLDALIAQVREALEEAPGVD